ncbi:hypothetical protein V496_06038 [Pseudogymnoascus sp. VKM F-4515 (FW-2607)]|nr:hypothetical protein V496_06038 [Pseudogymnoascus sp. VKM F-4515 (FW-2607)]KFY99977.1 hypothetical protein V498_00383 [Pseudogymnoascus sp. VKM F-4517 (FW-2822)]
MSTPSSTSSTANLAPAPPTLAIKPVSMGSNSMGSPMNSCDSPVSLGLGPRREWVIPPRPKPGRKPATDTPPTKRKAQNRAAQRAFRERRAARVGELEEQLKETEEERLKREAQTKAELDDARSHVTKLEADMQRVLNEVIEWRQKYHRAEDMLEAERAEKATLNTELIYLRKGARAIGTDAVVLPPRRNRAHLKPESAQLQNPAPTQNADPLGCGNCTSTSGCACVDKVMVMATSACGRCSVDSHCECLEETLKAPNTAGSDMEVEVKRSRDSSPFTNSKRTRMSIEDNTPQEIDFTAMFSSKPIYAPEPPPRDYGTTNAASRPPPGESCGFCDDSTYCACAEAAEVAARELEHENRLPPLMSEVTPPPSDSDVNAVDSYKLPSLYPNRHIQSLAPASKSAGSPSNSCANGPGTCQQCQDDPKSGLFCRSLAAIRAADPSFSGCCGQGGPGGCCKDPPPQPPPRPEPRKSKPVLPGPALSCAETYKTLASHRNFEAASDEISKWLPKLATAPPRYPGREATDIDAASVMSVIKYFDVRFGRE